MGCREASFSGLALEGDQLAVYAAFSAALRVLTHNLTPNARRGSKIPEKQKTRMSEGLSARSRVEVFQKRPIGTDRRSLEGF